jgi:hypothetical protein
MGESGQALGDGPEVTQPQSIRQWGSALRKLIRSVAAAELDRDSVDKDQERNDSPKAQSETGIKASEERPLIGPGV